MLVCKNPREIPDAYKEAVVDSLLNTLVARLSGKGAAHEVILGIKPSAALVSGFLLPMPDQEREGDEEADPIRISAHGIDFQIAAGSATSPLTVRLEGCVYVRVLPEAAEIAPGQPLCPVFPLTSQATQAVRTGIRQALTNLATTLPGGKSSPQWGQESLAARKRVYDELGLPFEAEATNAQVEQEAVEGNAAESSAEVVSNTSAKSIPDDMAQEIAPPAKWVRLPLDLPGFTFTANTAGADAASASATLNERIAAQLEAWAQSTQAPFGGKIRGFRKGLRIRPSQVKEWDKYLLSVAASQLSVVTPKLDLRWDVKAISDPVNPALLSVHVAVENWSEPLTGAVAKESEPVLFQVKVSVELPRDAHRSLKLDRVKPSYRYNKYLRYPALGFNAGVVSLHTKNTLTLSTTWAPRYVLPRIVPTSHDVVLNIESLSQSDSLAGLEPLVPAYEGWLNNVASYPVGQGIEGDPQSVQFQTQMEEGKLAHDLQEWGMELEGIKSGLAILKHSRAHWSGPGPQKSPLGVPFEAWVCMNAAMAKVAASKGYDEWRLFQLVFILSNVATFATRIPGFESFYTKAVSTQANAVTLLYFATGGGKSEAFLGLLSFVLFLDRLRNKLEGVSALMRYPLRLLTLQQARRTMGVLAASETVRYQRKHPGTPFSLGFWVGSSNTPNWHRQEGYEDVPALSDVPLVEEDTYRQANAAYKSAADRWLKLTRCPFCNSGKHPLALRRHTGAGGNLMGHFCSNPECHWNSRPGSPHPLPFYIVDEDIYDLAPSVLLGTVDKLSALGQSQGTIRRFFGMFGFASVRERQTGRLEIPMRQKDWDGHPGTLSTALYPVFANGERRFFDPFPSLVIQDEAHLLDESLGTFAGLFETALEAGFDQLAPLLKDQLCVEPVTGIRRKSKIIAASATVNEPARQMRNLYQREKTFQFPHPGPDLYHSFYAEPKSPGDGDEDLERRAIPLDEEELRSHWARVYISVLTNGHRHTVAMAQVLGQFHLLVTQLYELLRSEDPVQQDAVRQLLCEGVSEGALRAQFRRLLSSATPQWLLTLVDLHRIALTYVTNKKGGDQVIDTEKVQFERLHETNGFPGHRLQSELISGAVSAAAIQDIVRRAETRVAPGQPFPPVSDTLRSVIATSAISHGVDVEEFNSMFFAGLPSDMAEFIQASSRVGRTHVGFSLLVPVPQRHRDRFVLEIHDIFHRFLERMVTPAAVDRWAEKALERVLPSFFQEYLCGVFALEQLCARDDSKKAQSPAYSMAEQARDFMGQHANTVRAQAFLERALGLDFLPTPEGAAYYKALIKKQLSLYHNDLHSDRHTLGHTLVKFFELRNTLLRPMTSLRDVDLPGVIFASDSDAFSRSTTQKATSRALEFIRKGSGSELDNDA